MNLKNFRYLSLMMSLVVNCADASPEIIFSTYLGGSDNDQPAGDIFIDNNSNIYITGPTNSADFPVTEGAYDTSFNDLSGWSDAFVAKLDPQGNIIWSTFMGTPTRDCFYTIKVDDEGYVYLAGSFGPGARTTPGVLQRTFAGAERNGDQWDGYLAKLSPDGSRLVWATYLGTGSKDLIRNMDLDADGNLVLATSYRGSLWPAEWFHGGFQSEPRGGKDSVVMKVSPDARQVLWASYLGGSEDESLGPNLYVDDAGHVHVFTSTRSPDMPTTEGAYDREHNGGEDIYVATLSSDGSRLLMGTYLGSPDNDGAGGKRGIAVDMNGDLVISGWTKSSDFPTTERACRHKPMGFTPWGATGVTARFSPAGQLLASTYIGDPEGLSLDSQGNVYVATRTWDDLLPVTADAFQSQRKGVDEGILVVMSRDLDKVLYATYLGGERVDSARMTAVGPDDSFYVTGMTESDDFPMVAPIQKSRSGSEDVFLVRFSPLIADTTEPEVNNTSVSK